MRIVAAILLLLSGAATLGQEISSVGVLLRRQAGELIVQGILPNSPAAASKAIHRGDRLIAIAQGDGQQVPLTGLGLAEAVRLIRGPKGTVVRVTVVPAVKDDAETQVVRLVRGQLAVPAVRENFDLDEINLSLSLMSLGITLLRP